MRGRGGEACKTFGGWRRFCGRGERRRRGHLDSEGSGGGYEYIYTPPHTIPPPPFHFAVKTPPYTPTPHTRQRPIHANKKRQPKPAFPHPHSNYSVPSPAFSATSRRPLPPATAFSTFSRRATKSSKSSPTRASTYWLSNT